MALRRLNGVPRANSGVCARAAKHSARLAAKSDGIWVFGERSLFARWFGAASASARRAIAKLACAPVRAGRERADIHRLLSGVGVFSVVLV
jgi:hypothetical protein